jgi:Uma2 family endonuclease
VRSAVEPIRQAPAGQEDGERRFVLHDVGWEQYEALRGILDDSPGLRMTYLEGALELMSPSRRHEQHKKIIARLIEIYALERGIPLNGFGSTTFRQRAKERGAEPDECYMIGEAPALDDDSTPPHIAIEVVMTRSQIDKLSVYAGLRVPELWFWDGQSFVLHRLDDEHYTVVDRSRFLPELDLNGLAGFIGNADQTATVRAFLDRLRAGS